MFSKIGVAEAIGLQCQAMANPEHLKKTIGPAIFEIHFQLCNIGRTAIAPCGHRDVVQMLEHLVTFVFAKLLELRL
ncbi:hypothetical protein RRU01S_29_01140 [Agrobacterium rubi TR3 = NBRC 13261]|uniref:Uncharacterized protein n=1 Tax=Agrobacterium rubi TR3 = NBRC 13261 TaxID=1368415 RepID=A0A081D251_9HYPH|nr:hypothetical protein RRU01S_29_01140 [Agrobacterium rubi TR3 = NBRC 13261]